MGWLVLPAGAWEGCSGGGDAGESGGRDTRGRSGSAIRDSPRRSEKWKTQTQNQKSRSVARMATTRPRSQMKKKGEGRGSYRHVSANSSMATQTHNHRSTRKSEAPHTRASDDPGTTRRRRTSDAHPVAASPAFSSHCSPSQLENLLVGCYVRGQATEPISADARRRARKWRATAGIGRAVQA